MIYTVTLNPTLDITYVVNEIKFEEPVLASRVLKNPGGKGINVSRALHSMGVDSLAIALIGGFTGEEVLALLNEEGLKIDFIRIENETRTNVIILGEKNGTELVIRSAGPPVIKKDTEDICRHIFKIALAPGILVLSGSLPPGVDNDIYASLIAYGKSKGMKTVLDSDGEPFAIGLREKPYLIKPNYKELTRLAGREFDDDDAIIEFCRGLTGEGIELMVVSLGGKGALLITSEGAWRGTVPYIEKEDTVGAGDSMVAGMVMSIIQHKPLQETFELGLACGVSAVMNKGPGLCEPKTLARALSKIKVEKIL